MWASKGRPGLPWVMAASLAWVGCDAESQSPGAAVPEARTADAVARAMEDARPVTRRSAQPPREPATPAQLRELEAMIAPQLARPANLEVELHADGSSVLHAAGGYHSVTIAILREDGELEVMCLEQPIIPDHRRRQPEAR